MHKSRLACFVIDCQVEDINPGADFWAGALGYPTGDADEKYVVLEATPTGPKMLLQKVEHPSRIHLDIETDNKEAEVQRLEKLGAKVVKIMERWTIMEAPTGHRFCVVNPQRPDFHEATDVNVWK